MNLSSLKRHLGLAILTWFITFSLCLMLSILLLEKEVENGVPSVFNNLWEASLVVIPAYILSAIVFRKGLAIIAAITLTLLLSMYASFWQFPNSKHIVFLGNKEIEDEADTDNESDEIDDASMGLPDEL